MTANFEDALDVGGAGREQDGQRRPRRDHPAAPPYEGIRGKRDHLPSKHKQATIIDAT
jgi:hypothetical protein